MIHWCTVLVGMSLAFAVSTKHIEPLLSEEKIISANLNDLIQKIQIETLREKNMEEENQFPRTHEVVRIPNQFYGREFIDYAGANYPGIVGALEIDYVSSSEDNLSSDPEQLIPPNQENIQLEDQNHVNLLMDMNNNYDEDIENVDPNIVQPLNVWPQFIPVYAEKIPSLENFGNDDLDILNPANTEFLQSNARPNRRLNNNFMAELGYEAMMNNMLPTMPYVRGAEYVPLPMSQTDILVPENLREYLNSRGLSIVFSCHPNFYNGISGLFEQPAPPATPATMASPPRGDIEFLDDVGSTDEDE